MVAIFNPVEECSGYLVLPDLVLTARHCVSPLNNGTACVAYTDHTGALHATSAPGDPYDASQITVTNDLFVTDVQSRYVAGAEVLILPDSTGAELCGQDLALIRLERPLPHAQPIALRLDLPPYVGELVTTVGYGRSIGSDADSINERLELTGRSVTQLGLQMGSEPGQVLMTEADLRVDSGPCFGDSGSPLLDGQGRSIGVMSRGHGDVCTDMIYGRVDSHADWLRAQITAVATRDGGAAPAWLAQPAAGSARFGDGCTSATQCAAPYACRPVAGDFRCVTTDCSACPGGSACGATADGSMACIPGPDWDAGAPPDAATGDDAGTGSGGSHGGCSAAPGARGEGARGVAAVLIAVAALASVGGLRRRARGPR